MELPRSCAGSRLTGHANIRMHTMVVSWLLIGSISGISHLRLHGGRYQVQMSSLCLQATKRVVPYLFVRGDGVILVSPPLRS